MYVSVETQELPDGVTMPEDKVGRPGKCDTEVVDDDFGDGLIEDGLSRSDRACLRICC